MFRLRLLAHYHGCAEYTLVLQRRVSDCHAVSLRNRLEAAVTRGSQECSAQKVYSGARYVVAQRVLMSLRRGYVAVRVFTISSRSDCINEIRGMLTPRDAATFEFSAVEEEMQIIEHAQNVALVKCDSQHARSTGR